MAASITLGSTRDLLSAPIHRRRPSGLEGTVKEQMPPDLIIRVSLSFTVSVIRSEGVCVFTSELVYLCFI